MISTITNTHQNVKASKFNLSYKLSGKAVIFNSATGEWQCFSPIDVALVIGNKTHKLSPSSMKKAIGIGAVIDAKHDENQWYRNEYRHRISDRKTASYICVMTYRCNLNCPYCFEKSDGFIAHEVDYDFYERLLKAIKARALNDKLERLSLILFGGEPLLKQRQCLYLLKNMKAWCSNHNIKFIGIMSTNAVLLTHENVRLFAPYLDIVQVTFDGPRDIHDKLRITNKNEGTFDRIVQSIRLLNEYGISVHIRAQINLLEGGSLKDLLAELKERQILFLPKVLVSAAVLRCFPGCNVCDKFQNYAEQGSNQEQELIEYSEAVLPPKKPRVQILPCVLGENQLCVDPHGNLYKCMAMAKNVKKRVGYLDDSSFIFTDHLKEYESRDPLSFDDCKDCAYLPLCGGGCPTATMCEWDTYMHSFCGNAKKILDSRIRNYIKQYV